ncbi:MAG: tetratricopeptide repeat protein [Thermoplasmatota archaeon]
MAKGFTAKGKVLVHLLGHYENRDKYPQPVQITQEGIAETIGSKQNTVSYAVRNLVKEGLLYEKTTRIRGKKQRRKGYFLTEKGVEKAEEIREKMLRTPVKVTLNEEEREVLLKDVNKYYHTNFTIVELLKRAEDGKFILDADRREDVFVNHLPNMPKPPSIEIEELREMEGWWYDGGDILFIKGPEGYGKTSLVTSFIDEISESASIFYFKIKDWHTDRNFLIELSQYLSNAGEHKLSSYLEATNNINKKEALSNLKRDIQLIPEPILVVEDLDVNEEVSLLVEEITNELNSSSNVRFVFSISADVEIELDDGSKTIDLKENRSENVFYRSIIDHYNIDNTEKSELLSMVLNRYLTDEEYLLLVYVSVYRKPVEKQEIISLKSLNMNILTNLLNTPLLSLTVEDRPIVHDILRKRIWKAMSKRDKRVFHEMAAEYYEDLPAKSEIEKLESIFHLTKAKNVEELTDKLKKYGPMVIASGYSKNLLDILENIRIDEDFPLTKELIDYNIAEAYRVLGNFEKAIEKYNEIKDNAEDKELTTNVLIGFGKMMEKQGKIEEALDKYHAAVKASMNLGERGEKLQGEISLKLGELHINEGDYDKAKEYLEKSTRLFERNNMYSQLTNVYFLLARIEKNKGNWEETLHYFKKGIDYWKEINESFQRVGGLHEIGSFYKVIRELKNAEEFLIETIQTCERFGYRHLKASALVTLSEVYLERGEYEEAIESAAWAGEIFDMLGEEEEEAYTHALVGQAYTKLNLDDKAEEYLNKAISIFQKLGKSYSLGLTYFSMAKLQEKKGNRQGIADNYRKALLSLTSSGADRMARRVQRELSSVPLSM